MARAVWWALALAALASGARYPDYSEVKMPEYGSAIDYDAPRDSQAAAAAGAEADEYHEHAQEASPPLEYKYEEDRVKSDTRLKEVGETDEWQNSVKKHKKYLNNNNQENFDAYNSDEIPSNLKSNYKPSKHRPRLKPRNPHNEDSSVLHNKHGLRYAVNRKKDIDDIESKENSDVTENSFDDDKNIDFEEDQVQLKNSHRETTVRKVRRKPRDRFVKSEPISDEDDPIMNLRRRPIKDDFHSEDVTHARSVMKRPQYRQGVAKVGARGGSDQRPSRLDSNVYDDYSEYYDMKRVQGIKEKLLQENEVETRRTTTIHPLRTRGWPRSRLRVDDDPGLEGLRRLMQPFPTSAVSDNTYEQDEVDESIPRFKINIPTTDNTYGTDVYNTNVDNTDVQNTDSIDETRYLMRPTLDASLRRVLNTKATTLRTMPTLPTIAMTTTTKTTTPSTTTTTQETTTKEESIEIPTSTTEMSLAEKSRLSILRKSQRKEMLKESATKKPPVLLQVQNRLHTLVMVEPATSLRPWQRATEVQQDTLENVLKVKRLMRKKLVENARNIHDLSENWDDMICDYVDMALLETKAASMNSLHIFAMPFSCIAIALLKI